jgi:hypothetical protein
MPFTERISLQAGIYPARQRSSGFSCGGSCLAVREMPLIYRQGNDGIVRLKDFLFYIISKGL